MDVGARTQAGTKEVGTVAEEDARVFTMDEAEGDDMDAARWATDWKKVVEDNGYRKKV